MNPSQGLEVDHIDGNPLNNSRTNLRLCTRSQNNANWKGKHRAGSSQYRGVCLRKDTLKWQVNIQIDKNPIAIGCFEDEKEAANAYDVVSKQLFGEFAYQNFRDL